MQICTGFLDTQTGGLIKASRFDTGRVKLEHRRVLAKVNGAGAGSTEKA
jgi:hypothetical protein